MNVRTGPHTALHTPYLAALASQAEGSSGWLACHAGLLALRLVDQWMGTVGSGAAPAVEQLDAVHEAVDAVEPGPLQLLMQGVVDATLAAWGRANIGLGTALLAYGRRLHHEGAWPLASDVYETFIRYARMVGDDERLPDAYLRLGLAFRRREDLGAALGAYATAGALATAVGDRRVAWLARVGAANVERQRGDPDAAAAALDAVIAEAAPVVGNLPGADDVVARASHDRAIIEIDAGRFEDAVVLLHRALERYTDTRRRQRVLHDLALAFVELGMLDVGRDALQVVSATAEEPYLRLLADSNLMWVAVLAGQETVYERYRRALAEESLTDELAVAYATCVDEAERRFGAAVDIARVMPAWDGAPPPLVAHVANAVREMRAVVPVG